MVNIGFHRGGVGAQLISGNDARLDGLLHDPLMDLLGTFLAKERKTPTEITKIGNRIFISIHTTKDAKKRSLKKTLNRKETSFCSKARSARSRDRSSQLQTNWMKSWKKPTREQIERAVLLLTQGEQHRYFFDHLQNPEWLIPLKEKGYFSLPPAPIPDDVGPGFMLPIWPESRYLARMAKLAPETVAQILRSIPETENVRVHGDFVEAILAMPAKLAATFVPEVIKWINARFRLLFPERFGALLGHLAAAPMQTLTLLCDLLDQAIRLSQRDDKEGEPDDYSYIWRPAIEQPRHVVDNVRGMLVSAVCSAAERSARQDPTGTTGIISGLENRGWRIFHRIALHILQHWERFLRTDRLHPALYGFKHPSQYDKESLFKPASKANTKLILAEADNIQLILASLALKVTRQSVIIAKLGSYPKKNRTKKALWELDNLRRSLHLLNYVDSPSSSATSACAQPRRVRAVAYANGGKLRVRTDQEQQLWSECSRLLANCIIYYNDLSCVAHFFPRCRPKVERVDHPKTPFLRQRRSQLPCGWRQRCWV
jgi:Tn3 transposase DDE domain